MSIRLIPVFILLALAWLTFQAAMAQDIPRAITYQGRLTTLGLPVADSTYNLTFKFYTVATGGAAVWTSPVIAVVTSGGLFTTRIENVPDAAIPGADVWLETLVGGTALAPRVKLAAAPFALRAADLRLPFVKTLSAAAAAFSITNTSTDGTGLLGIADTGPNAFGVHGTSASHAGVWGNGGEYGLIGTSPTGIAVGGYTPGGYGVVGGSDAFDGVKGYHTSTGIGVHGISVSGTGVLGEANTGVAAIGVHGTSTDGIGVQGEGGAYGVIGKSSFSVGVYGISTNFEGVRGEGNNINHAAVVGVHNAGGTGVCGTSSGTGVVGISTGNAGAGVVGKADTGGSAIGVHGTSSEGNGVKGEGGLVGVYGTGTGYYGVGVYGAASVTGKAGYFDGHVEVTRSLFVSGDLYVGGTISNTPSVFKIDHPLDPANKTLAHAAVESPEMKDIYDGVAVLDANGEAAVNLPNYFSALNADFRYQLTAIGAPGPNLYIAEEITDNHFKIAGGKPGMKVSWQVTGIRQDASAKAHPLVVEEPKPATERGYYLEPELFGQPESKNVDNVRPGGKPTLADPPAGK